MASRELELAAHEACADHARALGWVNPWASGSLAIWLARLEMPADLPAELPEPFAREIAGDWPGAASAAAARQAARIGIGTPA